jgi:hypothetical protein
LAIHLNRLAILAEGAETDDRAHTRRKLPKLLPQFCRNSAYNAASAGFRRSSSGITSMKTLVAMLVALGLAAPFTVMPVFAQDTPTDQASCEDAGYTWNDEMQTCETGE